MSQSKNTPNWRSLNTQLPIPVPSWTGPASNIGYISRWLQVTLRDKYIGSYSIHQYDIHPGNLVALLDIALPIIGSWSLMTLSKYILLDQLDRTQSEKWPNLQECGSYIPWYICSSIYTPAQPIWSRGILYMKLVGTCKINMNFVTYLAHFMQYQVYYL